jgi:hypothetical protein
MTNEMIGSIFAHMASDTQAEFLNGLGRAARLSWKSEGGLHDMSCQCYHIMKDLDQDGKRFIRGMAEMVGSEEEEERELAEKRQAENTRIISDAEKELAKLKLERDELIARFSELEERITR